MRELLARNEILVMPGGFSPLLAKMAQEAGFESFFLAGSQLSAFLYGYPDTGVVGLRDFVDHARHIAARVDIPVLVDFDTGFGNAVNVWYAVQECVRSGAAALQIEDQEAPKKSGTLAGRRCISQREAVGKIRAAIDARQAIDPEFVVCARVDALGAEGETWESTLARCQAYADEGGADLIWLNSSQTREQLEEVCRKVKVPVLTIWGGAGPPPTPKELEALGVRVALYPTITASVGMQAAWHVLHDFKARGLPAIAEWQAQMRNGPYGVPNLAALTGLPKVRELEASFIPPESQRDYETTWGHRPAQEASENQR
ncbi:isocitrate lyase/PEP mutase family protein [Variovorax terrae]|uniref:Isocitrate lyase/PEP mutase family protein n=1 Tax=Variovorax terrae TaxID=2923278 RepID=A0A9X1VVI1_9BURK|nr:isocitrate lyase/PEP mutase family protein [Variovorax terrae]MCJ0764035.1 isocitrate lyase/PEP mutase family protein [Variovorax terrae]